MTNFIAYFGVSTERQGRSELGLAAQRRKIFDFVMGAGALIAEFCDVQSGKDDSRVELQHAIQLAKRTRRSLSNASIAFLAALAYR
jgi:DNA invertase Pin-like site-specific DNA recombinase